MVRWNAPNVWLTTSWTANINLETAFMHDIDKYKYLDINCEFGKSMWLGINVGYSVS